MTFWGFAEIRNEISLLDAGVQLIKEFALSLLTMKHRPTPGGARSLVARASTDLACYCLIVYLSYL